MEITVLKCDRCKREVDELVEFNFVNRNVQLEESKEDKKGLFGLVYGFSTNHKYPSVQGGLCLACIQEVTRWLGHQENSLENTKC